MNKPVIPENDRVDEAGPPVLMYPLHGCEALGVMDEKAMTKRMKQMRQTIRTHWNHDGVKAMIEMIQLRTARMQREAIQAGAGAHAQGQAFALDELITVFHGILVSID